ncbi:GNAT family N-acetyltransferase [Paenibacillus sp. GCM10023252]|uniref:GNAT family N-acetyltransferase n=1 Tax=Paenibacillus sp. GCM10023252 TaxID=3252649 RepID=UPI003623C377
MNIRILQESDAASYQQLRLSALQNSPEAFGSTYEREAAFCMETVAERVKPTPAKFVLGAFDDKMTLLGIVSFVRETGMKTAHKANIYGMYVAEEAQGKGIGRLLMMKLIELAQEYSGVEQLNLTVVSDNEPAKRLYGSLGFEVYGVERHALKYDGQYNDEDFMVLRLL